MGIIVETSAAFWRTGGREGRPVVSRVDVGRNDERLVEQPPGDVVDEQDDDEDVMEIEAEIEVFLEDDYPELCTYFDSTLKRVFELFHGEQDVLEGKQKVYRQSLLKRFEAAVAALLVTDIAFDKYTHRERCIAVVKKVREVLDAEPEEQRLRQIMYLFHSVILRTWQGEDAKASLNGIDVQIALGKKSIFAEEKE